MDDCAIPKDTMEGLTGGYMVQVIDIPMTLQHLGPKGNEENITRVSKLRVFSLYLEMKRVSVVRSRTLLYISTRNAGVALRCLFFGVWISPSKYVNENQTSRYLVRLSGKYPWKSRVKWEK